MLMWDTADAEVVLTHWLMVVPAPIFAAQKTGLRYGSCWWNLCTFLDQTLPKQSLCCQQLIACRKQIPEAGDDGLE